MDVKIILKFIYNKRKRTYSIRFFNVYNILENKHDVYRGKDCIKKFCESLREYAMKMINFKNIKMKQKSSKNHMKMQKSVKKNL